MVLVVLLWVYQRLWECCVADDEKTLSVDDLCVELRAGGVSGEHERQVRDQLGPPPRRFDLLDFLAYLPLFIMTHTSIVDHALDDTRDK